MLSQTARKNIYLKSPVFLQNLFVTAYGYYLRRFRYGRSTQDFVEWLSELEYASPSKMEKLENEALRNIITHAYERVPYYKRIFDRHGIQPKDIGDRNDLGKLPLLEKDPIRRDPEQLVSKKSNPEKLEIAYTSGTTGTPLKLYQSKMLIQTAYACHAILRKWAGVSFDDRRATFGGRLILSSAQWKPPFWRYNASENQMIFSSYHLSERNLPCYIEKLLEFQPKEVIGYPSSIYNIANYLKRNNINRIKPKVVLTNSETLLFWQRETIEAAFDCKVYDWYSSEEFACFIAQCEMGSYHIFPLIGIVEIVDPSNGKVTNSGEGEIVCTSLLNMDMPLIRYRIGDTAVRSNGTCSCGRSWSTLESIVGRVDDYVVRRDGTRIGRLDHIFKGVKNIQEAQIEQLSLDNVQLNLVVDKQYDSADERLIEKNLKERIGPDMTLNFNYIKFIPRTGRGKFRSVISRLTLPPSRS